MPVAHAAARHTQGGRLQGRSDHHGHLMDADGGGNRGSQNTADNHLAAHLFACRSGRRATRIYKESTVYTAYSAIGYSVKSVIVPTLTHM